MLTRVLLGSPQALALLAEDKHKQREYPQHCPFCLSFIEPYNMLCLIPSYPAYPLERRYAVHCPECNTIGPQADTPRIAILRWNEAYRPDPDA